MATPCLHPPVACTLQVMQLRRRFDELSGEVSRLAQQRELLLTQMADEQAEWEKRQQVGAAGGRHMTPC